MKKVEAYIKPLRANDVKNALNEAGFSSFQMYEVHESMDTSHQERVSGTEYPVDLVPRSVIRFLVKDNELEDALKLIRKSAKTGNPDDGKILVTNIDHLEYIGE
ncbi:MAG: P-II family nitrogen regulator [Spirochaetia bacterium]|nr:P-II family nitrogen regulator [Spirochaetia bacterium]